MTIFTVVKMNLSFLQHWQLEYAPAHMEQGMQHPHGYHVMPSLYFSNFTANVNVHGYTQAMQPSYVHPNSQAYVPTDGQQNAVEQVSNGVMCEL